MRRIVSSVFLLMMFLASSSLAQVRIREKFEISPKPPNVVQSTSVGNISLLVTFSFTGSIRPDKPRFLRATNCATDQFVDPMSTSATISIPARSGWNTTVARWSIPAGTSGTAKLKIEADGVVLREDSITVNCFCTLQMNPEVFLQSGVKFTLPGSITHGQSAPIGMTNVPFTNCSNTVWHPNMRTTITIAQGASFGSFYDENGNRLGTSATGNQFELSKVRFVADGDQPEGGKGILTLEASSQGATIGSTDVEIEASSTPPVVDSVGTSTGKLSFPVGSTVTLQGYYHDQDNDVTSAAWSLVSAPISLSSSSNGGPPLVASSSNSVTSPASQLFPLDREGFYLFRFTVTDAGGSTVAANLQIEAFGLDHFVVTTSPDTVEFGKTAVVHAQAKNKESTDINIDANTGLNIVLAQDEKYGNLMGPNGSIGKSVGALYSDLQNGKVQFLANGDPPGLTRQTVQIGVSKIGQESKNGTGFVIVKGEPMLVIISPLTSAEEKRITEKPEMPVLEAKAQLRNFSGGTVKFIWYFMLRWKSPEPRQFEDVFQGESTAENSDLTIWKIPWDNKIRGGDDMILRVTAQVMDLTFEAEVTNPYKIGGDNPSVEAVKDGLTVEEQVIAYMESMPKWKHFTSDGFPIFGEPHGYGLMQIDNPSATDEEVWNWTANKEAGKILLALKRNDAVGYPGRIRAKAQNGKLEPGYLNTADLDIEELIWKETFQRYNGGSNWYWKPDDLLDPNSDGSWVQRTGTSGYGVMAWDILTKVRSDNPPSGW